MHHTVSLNDYSPEEAPGIVLAICRYHRNSNGWNDIGYQALVDKYGVLYEGRAGGLDKPVLGAHAQGYNAQSTGIASIGDNSSVGLSDTALDALAGYIRWKLTIHGQPLTGQTTLVSAGGATSRYPAGRRVRVPRVLGHRDTNSTACPGSALYSQLDDLRARVATGEPLPGRGHVPVRVAVALARPLPAGGHGHRHAHRPTSSPRSPAQPVRVQVLRGGRWRTLAEPDDRRRRRLERDRARRRARGSCAPPTRATAFWRRSFSPEQLLRVVPLVELDATSALAVRGRPVGVRGHVTPRKRRVYQVLQQRIRGVYRQVGVRSVRVRAGRFRSSFAPSFAGLYRVYVLRRGRRRHRPRPLAAARGAGGAAVAGRVSPSPAAASPSRARGRSAAAAPCAQDAAGRAAASGCPRTRRPARSARARAATRGRSPAPSR